METEQSAECRLYVCVAQYMLIRYSREGILSGLRMLWFTVLHRSEVPP